VTGRFLSVDTGKAKLTEPQTLNRYAYTGGNPLRYIDPDGKERAQILLDQDVRELVQGKISRDEYQARLNARGMGALVGAGALSGYLGAEAGFMALAVKFPRLFGALTLAGAALTDQPVVSNFSRALTAADLGIEGVVKQVSGTFAVSDGVAKVSVGMIEAQIKNPLQIVSNLVQLAQKSGASTLEIRGILANPRLLEVLAKRYGLKTEGGADFIIINLKQQK
jgi:hypothetical protein